MWLTMFTQRKSTIVVAGFLLVAFLDTLLERLNALLFAFLHAHVDAEGVTRTERGNVAEPLFLGFDEGMHMTLWPQGPDGTGVLVETWDIKVPAAGSLGFGWA